jgi:hypothetical protein
MTMTGFSVVLNCNGHREVMIVNPIGCETEENIITKAFVAARNGYPQGNIDVMEVRQNQKWFVCGLPADATNECWWQS